jgi:hypothetical protein
MGKVISGDFKQKVAKKNFQELCEEVVGAINMESHPFPTPWPHKYHVLEPSPGARLILEESDGQVLTSVPPARLAGHVAQWLRLMNVPEWCINDKQAMTIANTWRLAGDTLEPHMLKTLRWASDPGYCWDRMPWDLSAYGQDCPTWDGLLSRMTNSQAFIEYIGSLFYDESCLQNYLWCHGQGNDGKGAINRFLAKVFAKSYRSKQPPDRSTKIGNWLHGLIGSRLVAFPDCNNASFVSSGVFKAMTGGDPVDLEAKYRDSFTGKLNCKFIFFSNETPNLSSERADMRRIIYCEFTKPGEYDPSFEDKLWEEGGAFISSCCQQYINTYPKHGPIKSETDAIEDIVSENEEHFQVFFDQHFELCTPEHDTSEKLSKLELSKDALSRFAVLPSALQTVGMPAFGKHGLSDFRAWMLRKFGIKKRGVVTSTAVNGVGAAVKRVDYFYVGMQPRD